MQRLEEIEEPNENNSADINDILDEIGFLNYFFKLSIWKGDLVCDIDLALIFCNIGGLALVKKFLVNFKNFMCFRFLFIKVTTFFNLYFIKINFFEKNTSIPQSNNK